MASEPSKQSRDIYLNRRLKIAKITELEIESAKTRQEIFEKIGKMYGATRDK